MNSPDFAFESDSTDPDYSPDDQARDIVIASETIDVSRFTRLTGLTRGQHEVYTVTHDGIFPTRYPTTGLPDGYLSPSEDEALSEEAEVLHFPCSASALVAWWRRDGFRYLTLPDQFVLAVDKCKESATLSTASPNKRALHLIPVEETAASGKDSIPGKLPHTLVGKLAVQAAFEIEQETSKRAAATDVLIRLQRWAELGEVPDVLITPEYQKRAVVWQTVDATRKDYTLDACRKTLGKWFKSRT